MAAGQIIVRMSLAQFDLDKRGDSAGFIFKASLLFFGGGRLIKSYW
jgi:hypothetical protein